MSYCSRFQNRAGVVFALLMLWTQSAVAINTSAHYKVLVLACQSEVQELVGEFEARAFWGLAIDPKNRDKKILDGVEKFSPILANRVSTSLTQLKSKVSSGDLSHIRSEQGILSAPKNCEFKVIAIRDGDRKVQVDTALWAMTSEALKDRIFLEMAWQEFNSNWSRLLAAYIASESFQLDKSVQKLEWMRRFYSMDQAIGYLKFNGFLLNEFRGVPVVDLRLMRDDPGSTPPWLKEGPDQTLVFGNLRDPYSECIGKKSTSGTAILDCSAFEENPYFASLEDPRVKFPIDIKEFKSFPIGCPFNPNSSDDRCENWVSANWQVTFANDSQSEVKSLECRSHAVGNMHFLWWAGERNIARRLFNYVCPLNVFGQDLVVFDAIVNRKFERGIYAVTDLKVEFTGDEIHLNLPLPNELDSSKTLAQRFYRNPQDGFFYGGRIVLNQQGQVTNTDAVRIEETRFKNEGVLK